MFISFIYLISLFISQAILTPGILVVFLMVDMASIEAISEYLKMD